MEEPETLLHAVDRLEIIQLDIAMAASSGADGYLLRIVRLRKELAMQFGKIKMLGDLWFKNKADIQEFNQLFSAMRSKSALHQASWPAVSIKSPLEADYLASAMPMRGANEAFVFWIRRRLQT